MKTNRFISLLPLLLLFTACSSDPAVTPNSKLGDTWVVRYTDFNEDGSVASQQDITLSTTEVIYNGESWVNLASPPSVVLGTYTMKPDGLHHLRNNSTDQLFFSYPGTVGDSAAVVLDNGDFAYHLLTATGQSVNVPLGTVSNCHYYEQYDLNSIEAYIWFTENEWFVKFQEFDDHTVGPGSFMDYQYELVSYTQN